MKGYYSFLIILFAISRIYAYQLPYEYTEALKLIESGKRVEASELLKRCTEKYSDWGIFHLEYAINCIYIECKDEEIKRSLDIASKLLGDNPRLYFYKGLYMEGKDIDEALMFYDRAISLRPDYFDALIRACALYADKGDVRSAMAYYDSIPPEKRSSTLILKMVDLLIKEKDYLRAEKELLFLNNSHPDNVLYLTKMLEFYRLKGDGEGIMSVERRLNRLLHGKKRVMRPLR